MSEPVSASHRFKKMMEGRDPEEKLNGISIKEFSEQLETLEGVNKAQEGTYVDLRLCPNDATTLWTAMTIERKRMEKAPFQLVPIEFYTHLEERIENAVMQLEDMEVTGGE